MKNVVGIGHIAIRVKDIDRTLDFYRDKLGFKEMFRLHRDGKLWLMYLRVTDTQYIELFPEAVGDRAPGRDANGLNHLCLEIDSLDAAVEELTEAGVTITREKQMGADGNLQAWIEDPDGNRIELMQMDPKNMQNAALKRLKAGG
jgi:catechol 2,3-dioxygenase-like lactoylglutathione lyase family enzyme